MKRKLELIKSALSKKRFLRKNFLLSIVALIEVVLILIVSTFAWVETISTIDISGSGKIDKPVLTVANISDTTTTQSIDLSAYFRSSGNVHLAASSSANGKDIYFPKVTQAGTSASAYRKSNINDENVNYISFSFKVSAANATRYFYFKNTPTIKVGGTTVNNNDIRIAITASNTTTIYAKTSASESVVADVTGTKSSTSLKAFEDYTDTDENNPVFSVSRGATEVVTVTLWLQQTSTSGNYAGKTVTVEDFALVKGTPWYTVTAHAVTNVTSDRSTGGTVKFSTDTAGEASVTKTVKSGTSVSLDAVVNTASTNTYQFTGWYSAATGGSSKTTNTRYTLSITSDTDVYARFMQEFTVTAHSVVSGSSTASTTGGTVKYGSGTAGSTATAKVTYDSSVTFTATAKSGYTLEGWYSTATGGSSKSTSTSYTLSNVTSNTNIYARFKKSESTTTIYFESRSGFSSYNAWVYSSSDSNKNYSGGTWPGKAATYDSSTGYYKYEFTTSDTGKFRVIVSSGSGSPQYPASGEGLEGTIGGTYLFRANDMIDYYNDKITITFDISSTTWVNDGSAVMYLYDTATSKNYRMTKGSNKWTVQISPSEVPANKSLRFYRCTPAGFGTNQVSGDGSESKPGYWNSWSAGSRGTKTTYKTSGDGSGSWQ